MSKQCSVCSLSDEVLTKVFALHTLGASQQKIVKTIQEQFSLAVSASALNRHFNHCTSNCTPTGRGKLELSSLREKLYLPVMTGEEIYRVQRRIFAEEMECFVRRMAQKEPTDMSLDDLKCLDVLMGMRVKLYPSDQKEDDPLAELLHKHQFSREEIAVLQETIRKKTLEIILEIAQEIVKNRPKTHESQIPQKPS
jgi:hypothetical protein